MAVTRQYATLVLRWIQTFSGCSAPGYGLRLRLFGAIPPLGRASSRSSTPLIMPRASIAPHSRTG